jgi:hypothetical protein
MDELSVHQNMHTKESRQERKGPTQERKTGARAAHCTLYWAPVRFPCFSFFGFDPEGRVATQHHPGVRCCTQLALGDNITVMITTPPLKFIYSHAPALRLYNK